MPPNNVERSTVSCTSDEVDTSGCTYTQREDRVVSNSKPSAYCNTIPTLDQAQIVIHDIQQHLVGQYDLFDTPFGMKAVQYADWTASGRPLACIEDYMRDNVLPFYANTHTTTSITGLQTTSFRDEARQIIAQAVKARNTEDCVLFTGQGTTSAVSKLVIALGLHHPLPSTNTNDRPVVFVGPFEHHSNILPWRESCAEVIQIPEDCDGKVDVAFLEKQLKLHTRRPLRIGSFSAASNVSGILTDVDHISSVLHKHGALAFWDYASCAPYVDIDMNPVGKGPMPSLAYKDAVFFSGHKFVGGPNTPGVLVCKKRLLGNAVPTAPGGGTVFFVTKDDHRYLSNKVEREEGGTPDILGSIRLGLAFEIKQRVHPTHILQIEHEHVHTVRQSLGSNPNIVLLGRNDCSRLPIFSFLIRFGERFLHFNFVCALLNDLFGIQTRGGCQCAGPYSTRILGITNDDLFAFERAMVDKQLVLRAGFSRLSFPYFLRTSDMDYMLEALHFMANDGWKFLPFYRFNHKTGTWKHHTRFTKFPNRQWLISFSTSQTSTTPMKLGSNDDLLVHQQENLKQARELANDIMSQKKLPDMSSLGEVRDAQFDDLRWFVYPSEAIAAIQACQEPALSTEIVGPVQPHRYHQHASGLAYSNNEPFSCLLESSPQWTQLERGPEDQEDLPHASEVEQPRQTQQDPQDDHVSAAENRVIDAKRPLRSAKDSNVDKNSSISFAFDHVQQSTEAITDVVNNAWAFPTPPPALMKWVTTAVTKWHMIQQNDRLLVGVSGGRASLVLLHVLLHFQKHSRLHFKIACATIDPGTTAYDPSPLTTYIESLGVPHFYIRENIVERAKTEMRGHSVLAYTSRMKRGALYSCCRRHGFNKLVLGHDLDDVAESFFLSAIHNGQLRTMRASYMNDAKDIHVVRPLVLVREHAIKQFANESRFPVINENVPQGFEIPKERQRIRGMLSKEECMFPELFGSLRRALEPLLSGDDKDVVNRVDKTEHTEMILHGQKKKTKLRAVLGRLLGVAHQ